MAQILESIKNQPAAFSLVLIHGSGTPKTTPGRPVAQPAGLQDQRMDMQERNARNQAVPRWCWSATSPTSSRRPAPWSARVAGLGRLDTLINNAGVMPLGQDQQHLVTAQFGQAAGGSGGSSPYDPWPGLSRRRLGMIARFPRPRAAQSVMWQEAQMAGWQSLTYPRMSDQGGTVRPRTPRALASRPAARCRVQTLRRQVSQDDASSLAQRAEHLPTGADRRPGSSPRRTAKRTDSRPGHAGRGVPASPRPPSDQRSRQMTSHARRQLRTFAPERGDV
jgi:hypothetical protein